jgi:hypothetical protein
MTIFQMESRCCRGQTVQPSLVAFLIKWCRRPLAFASIIYLSGCQLPSTSAQTWSAVNNLPGVTPPNRIGAVSPVTTGPGAGRNTSGAAGRRSTHADAAVRMSIRQAIAEMVPHTYFVDIDEEINVDSMIQIHTTQNWLEALGQGVAEADIELITNLNKKSLFLRLKKRTLAEVIDRLLPEDFTVFTDADVNLQTLIHFDTRENWVQAFNHATRDTDIDFSVNFSSKVISLSPLSRQSADHVAARPISQ